MIPYIFFFLIALEAYTPWKKSNYIWNLRESTDNTNNSLFFFCITLLMF